VTAAAALASAAPAGTGAVPVRPGGPRLQAQFLDGFDGGRRVALWALPPNGMPSAGSILCIQPFLDEATLARRAIVAQALRLAARGWTTLVPDLYGTGDSDGETRDATFEHWRADLLRASRIARLRADGPHVVWGVRMGALLAAELSVALDQLAQGYVFWQPPASGKALIDPLLKLAKVGAVARAGESAGAASGAAASARVSAGPPASPVTPEAAASSAAASNTIELGGYRLARVLVDELAALTMSPPVAGTGSAPCPALMLGVQRNAGASMPAPKALSDLAERWLAAGSLASLRVVSGEPFWSSMEPSTPVGAFEATEAFMETVDGGG
jgi:exosortase A-associated hydrolase 2